MPTADGFALARPLDLPPCETAAVQMSDGFALGIVQPHAADPVLGYAGKLTLADPSANICAEAWTSVLPRWWPWAQELERGHGFALFALAFVLVVATLWALTPRAWWRRTTLLGLGSVLGLTWLTGITLLAAFHALGGQRLLYGTVVSLSMPQQARPSFVNIADARELEALLAQRGLLRTASMQPSHPAAPRAGEPAPPPPAEINLNPQTPAGAYQVAHRLNVRQGPGTQHQHLLTLPRAAVVQFDGATQSDWWRIRTANGQVGWASSLWLRRPGEGLPPPSGDTPPPNTPGVKG